MRPSGTFVATLFSALVGFLSYLPAHAAGADVVLAPMIFQGEDLSAVPNTDQWFLVADASGRVEVEVYVGAATGGTIDLDGLVPTVVPGSSVTTIFLDGVLAGSVHVFTYTQAEPDDSLHYRPRFRGVQHVFVTEDVNSPNDVFNGTNFDGSNIELGFDEGPELTSEFAHVAWSYELAVGDTISWTGFRDAFPGGADAVRLELFDPSGVSQDVATVPPLLNGAGTTLTGTAAAGQQGFWSVDVTAPEEALPFGGHYLMDVTITDSLDVVDVVKSRRHYLLPGAMLDPDAVPVPALAPASVAALVALMFLAGIRAQARC